MKKVIFLILFTVSYSYLNAQDTLIDMKFYKVLYSIGKKCPKEVFYIVHGDRCCSRLGKDFKPSRNIQSSNDADYRKNIYDKGHMVPAASMSFSCEALDSTFSYLNCAMQHFRLNRGVWSSLEHYERELVEIGYDVKVSVGVLFLGKVNKGKSGAWIPTHFYKIIKYEDQIETFLMPNDGLSGHYNDYRTTINKVKELVKQSR